MIKILMIIPSFYPSVGGAEKQLMSLASKISNYEKFSCFIFTRKIKSLVNLNKQFSFQIIRKSNFFYPYLFSISLILHIIFNKKKYDILHCHTLNFPAFITTLMGKMLNIPTVIKITRYGKGSQLNLYLNSYFRKKLLFYILKNSSAIICLNHKLKKEIFKVYKKSKVVVIPNGVEVNFKSRNVYHSNLLFVGRLIERKNIFKVIKLIKKEALLNIKLTIVGDGPQNLIIQNYIAKYKLKNINLIGNVDFSLMKKFYNNNDFFILPSSSEGLSNALLESMASGLTPIVSNISANTFVVEDNLNGFIFKNYNELKMILISLNNKNLKILNNKNMLDKISMFSFKRITNLYLGLYERLIYEKS